MALKAQKHGLIFRPHFKTHQSLEIGRWFKDFGITKIAVSSLEMALYFSEEWNDITVAFPTNILEIERINLLARKIQLNLLVESIETVQFLSQNVDYPVGFFIKIDTGYHRTGLLPTKINTIDEILKTSMASKNLNFKGFLAHSGHTYTCNSKADVLKIHSQCVNELSILKKKYVTMFPDIKASLGDTPSCSLADNFGSIDEIRPGNFVFYDLMQAKIGANNMDQIAVAMACPIVAIHDDRNEIVIYGGGVHFSKERLESEKDGVIYGRIFERKGNVWGNIVPDAYVKSLSQEHGIVSIPGDQIKNHKVGDCLMVLPIHSCMTANLMKRYKIEGRKDILMMNSQ
ncbi:alanine racemase [Aquimarina gracilis]